MFCLIHVASLFAVWHYIYFYRVFLQEIEAATEKPMSKDYSSSLIKNPVILSCKVQAISVPIHNNQTGTGRFSDQKHSIRMSSKIKGGAFQTKVSNLVSRT